jgi:hypothetical protein
MSGNPADLAPAGVTALFVALVLVMAALCVAGVAAAARSAGWSARAPIVTAVAIAAWLALTIGLAASGAVADFSTLPPRFLFLFVPPLAALVALGRSRALVSLLAAAPPTWAVYAQSFRIVVEVVLWLLVASQAAPEIMSFHGQGRNFDILVGLTAAVVGWACLSARRWPRQVAVWWNVAGIVVLVNTVLHAQLATPTRFQRFVTDPPNTFIVSAPYVWLPAFLVPLAWGLHVISLRQLRWTR